MVIYLMVKVNKKKSVNSNNIFQGRIIASTIGGNSLE